MKITLEDKLKKAETIISETENLAGEDTLNTAKYQEIMAGIGRADAILHRIMNNYATGQASLSVSQVYLASDLLERLHQAKYHLPSRFQK